MKKHIARELLHLAREIVGYSFYNLGKDKVLFSGAGWLNSYIERVGENRYYYVKFKTLAQFKKQMNEMSADEAAVLFYSKIGGVLFRPSDVTSIEVFRSLWESTVKPYRLRSIPISVKRYWPTLIKMHGKDFFVAMPDEVKHFLLQQAREISGEELYDEVVVKGKIHENIIKDIIGDFYSGGGTEKTGGFAYKKWEVRYEKEGLKFNEEDIVGVLDKIDQLLNGKGLGELCYGKVFLVASLAGGRIADYLPSDDGIRLRAGKRNKGDEIFALLHELGHRYWRKFADADLKSEVAKKYNVVARDFISTDSLGVKVGDALVYHAPHTTNNKQTIYRVLRDNITSVIVEVTFSSYRPNDVGKQFKIKPNSIAAADFEILGKEKGYTDRTSYLVSAYAMSDGEEFFCELFAAYVLGELKGEAKIWFAGLGL